MEKRQSHLRLVSSGGRLVGRPPPRRSAPKQNIRRHTLDSPALGSSNDGLPPDRRNAVSPIPLLDVDVPDRNAGRVGHIRREVGITGPLPDDVLKRVHGHKIRCVFTNVNTTGIAKPDKNARMHRTPHERLREARLSRHTSAKAACDAYGFKYPTYVSHENGTRAFNTSDAQRYARAFGVNWVWIMTGIDPNKAMDPDQVAAAEYIAAMPTNLRQQALIMLRALADSASDSAA